MPFYNFHDERRLRSFLFKSLKGPSLIKQISAKKFRDSSVQTNEIKFGTLNFEQYLKTNNFELKRRATLIYFEILRNVLSSALSVQAQAVSKRAIEIFVSESVYSVFLRHSSISTVEHQQEAVWVNYHLYSCYDFRYNISFQRSRCSLNHGIITVVKFTMQY